MENNHKELKELLKYQYIKDDFMQKMWRYCKEETARNRDQVILFIDTFNYGYICGIRAERAKRRKKDSNGKS